jgi:transposase-like protein
MGLVRWPYLAWSGVLWLIRDVAAAVRLWRERNESQSEPRVVNVDEPVADDGSDPLIDAIETLATAVKDIQNRIEAIETAKPVDPPKATTRRRANG